MLPRVAGVLMPLFSLRTPDDLGRGEILDLAPMVDFAREMGLGLIQLLPLDEGAPEETSPYSAMSVFAIDPTLLSLRGVDGIVRGSVTRARRKLANQHLAGGRRVAVRAAKLPLLERAWRKSHEGLAHRKEFESYSERHHEWLADYALFRALKDRFKWAPWEDWPAELRNRERFALDSARRELTEPIARYCWFQFLAERQWSAMHSYAAEHQVMIGGDMAFSPARDSAEVWANQALFDLARTIGTPPDAFNPRGQRWGLPLPRWARMREDGFKLWRARVRRAAAMFDLLRIDHVVGLYRTFSFGEEPEAQGSFVPEDDSAQQAQGEEILGALRDAAGGRCELVAEDLGSVPPRVRASLCRLGIAGYKVMQWERTAWETRQERFLNPAEYPELSLATTGTHDTEPLTTWWLAQPQPERVKLVEALGISGRIDTRKPLDDSALDGIIGSLYASPARLVVLPIQDLFGWSDQINHPGIVSDANWSYRLRFELQDRGKLPEIQSRIEKLRAIARQSARA
jgi:4-alpha-glucanotransferase